MSITRINNYHNLSKFGMPMYIHQPFLSLQQFIRKLPLQNTIPMISGTPFFSMTAFANSATLLLDLYKHTNVTIIISIDHTTHKNNSIFNPIKINSSQKSSPFFFHGQIYYIKVRCTNIWHYLEPGRFYHKKTKPKNIKCLYIKILFFQLLHLFLSNYILKTFTFISIKV